MGADIWLGEPGEGRGYFRDSYGGYTTLNYLGLSYWQDLLPQLTGGVFPLDKNEWLLTELRQRVADRVTAPDAVVKATKWIAEYERGGDPTEMVKLWHAHIQGLIDLLERSTALGIPLTMSL